MNDSPHSAYSSMNPDVYHRVSLKGSSKLIKATMWLDSNETAFIVESTKYGLLKQQKILLKGTCR